MSRFPIKDCQKILKTPDITIYPEKYFIPFRYRETFTPTCITNDTYTVHWFGGSWLKEDVFYFLSHKLEFRDRNFKKPEPQYIRISKISLFKLIPILKIVDNQSLRQKKYLLFNFMPIYELRSERIKFLGMNILMKKRI